MDTIIFPWTAEVVLISWRSVRNKRRPPLPSELLASFVIFGTFSLVAVRSEKVASVLGWGVVVATALNFFPSALGIPGKPGPSLTTPRNDAGANIGGVGAQPYAYQIPTAPSALNQFPKGV